MITKTPGKGLNLARIQEIGGKCGSLISRFRYIDATGFRDVPERSRCQSDDMSEPEVLGQAKQLPGQIVPFTRNGPKPRTHTNLPHRQIDQFPPPQIFYGLIDRCLKTPPMGLQESRLAPPETIALWLPHDSAHGPASAFIDDHEFCHIHPLPEGSIHLTLPPAVARRAIEFGWAEPHTLTVTGFMAKTLVMVYAPRDDEEADVVWNLIMASFHFASGH